MNKVHFSHNRDDWKTPKDIYDQFINHGYFDPYPPNPTFNGLEIEWGKKNFVNPPYSEIRKWVDKALKEVQKGKMVVFLVPARTDTKWFHEILVCGYRTDFQFIKGRLKFDDQKQPAPFPSVYITIKRFDYE